MFASKSVCLSPFCCFACHYTELIKVLLKKIVIDIFSICPVSTCLYIQMFIGDGAKMVRDAFALAQEKAPAIIFIDELDAIGTKVCMCAWVQVPPRADL